MRPISRRRWICRGDGLGEELSISLGRDLGILPLTANALFCRGIVDSQEGLSFLESRLGALPDPFLLPGMDRAAERLRRAIQDRESILVHGDYDVDGITGTAMLVETLRALGGRVDYFIPLRLKDGYGLSGEALQRAAADGVKVVLSVDCGISAKEEARLASELGLDLIITDHHQPPESLPEAFALVNPCLPGSPSPFKNLSGAGVAFFLLAALRKVLRDAGAFSGRTEPDLRQVLDLVALGTIADIVPLLGVNRTLTRAGLAILSGSNRPGIVALREVSGTREVTCGAVGFRLAPRLNAAGRLEDAALGVELLLERRPDRAREIASELDRYNRERQQIEQETLHSAMEQLTRSTDDRRTIVLSDEGWHPGVIGIVASRLVERFHRPVVLIAIEKGQGKGSARSIAGFHLYRALQKCGDHLSAFGGHECAAGLTIHADRLESFRSAFEEVGQEILKDEDLVPRMLYDREVLLEELTPEAVQELSGLAPFGSGNPEPSFVALGVRLQQVRPVGEQHVRFVARQGGYTLPCIAFGMAERTSELSGEVDLLFSAGINEWRGSSSVQLQIRDIRSSGG